MRARLVAVLLCSPALAGCLVLRAGAGATAEASPGRGPLSARFDAEAGLAVQLERPGGSWLLSALAVHRERDADAVGWTLLALGAARPLGPPAGPAREAGAPTLAWPRQPAGPGLRDWGARLELGRSARGGYAGGALTSTARLTGAWTLTGVLAAGVNTGPEHGPSAGLHLLVGFN